VAANGAVITLAEGQTEVAIALVQTGAEVTADSSMQLSATFTGAGGTACTLEADLARGIFTWTGAENWIRYPLLHPGTQRMTTKTNFQQVNFTQPCRRTRRASVPARLRARGRGACGTRASSHQHRGLLTNSVASANWLRRSGTATRHVCEVGLRSDQNNQEKNVDSMRLSSNKSLERRMDTAQARRATTVHTGAPA
jgi:hypothetical protein